MDTTCKFCEQPILYGLVMFGDSPLHPACYDELQWELHQDSEPASESLLDLSWGGHPTETVLQEQTRDCPF